MHENVDWEIALITGIFKHASLVKVSYLRFWLEIFDTQ